MSLINIVFIYLGCLCGYALIGGINAAYYAYECEKSGKKTDDLGVLLCLFVWPMLMPSMIGVAIFNKLFKKT